MEKWLLDVMGVINTYMADYVLIILLVAVGLFFSFKTRFVQVRCFGEGMKNVFGNFSLKGGKQKSGMSSFQALATAVAGQVGTGNIVGASGAILTGGPGAIFWMWIIAFLGMATIYAEAVLAQETRMVDSDGTVHGGPIYYIKSAFKGAFGKFLAGFFAIATVISLGFIGGMVQSNSIGATINTAFAIPTWVTGLVLAVIVAFIVIGGAQRIAATAEKIVPLMAILYIVGSLVVLAVNIARVPEAFGAIFKYAFQPQALIGGGIGIALKTAISQGAKRGLFSNEAGMGSTPHAHAMANVKKPHDQGVSAMMGVFLDTFVVLTCTALVIISSGLYTNGETAAVLAQSAFNASLGNAGNIFIAFCMLFFAFTTIVGWYYFGEVNVRSLFGEKAVKVYAVIVVLCVAVGATLKVDLVWNMSDMFNGLMVLPNLIALIPCVGIVKKLTKEYEAKKK